MICDSVEEWSSNTPPPALVPYIHFIDNISFHTAAMKTSCCSNNYPYWRGELCLHFNVFFFCCINNDRNALNAGYVEAEHREAFFPPESIMFLSILDNLQPMVLFCGCLTPPAGLQKISYFNSKQTAPYLRCSIKNFNFFWEAVLFGLDATFCYRIIGVLLCFLTGRDSSTQLSIISSAPREHSTTF